MGAKGAMGPAAVLCQQQIYDSAHKLQQRLPWNIPQSLEMATLWCQIPQISHVANPNLEPYWKRIWRN